MDNVKAQIEELLYNNAEDFEIAKVLKKDIKTYFSTLDDTFSSSGGKDFLLKHTRKIDTVLKMVYQVALRDMFCEYTPMKNSIPIALVALGSYGREQLCVHSDIDLMIVYKEIPGYNTKEMIEKILYILWDTGLKLGHRVHTVEELYEVSKTDITIKTALIESRFLEGSHFIWVDTQNAIRSIRKDNPKEFIALKLEEQAQKHKKLPLTMEPNLKDGVGGFRDANLVYWIGKILYNADTIKELPSTIVAEDEYKTFRAALEFLFRVRSALHLTAKKKEDKLRLELIPDVARLLKYKDNKQGHMKFAKRVTESLKITRLYSTIWINKLTHDYVEDDISRNYLYPKPGGFNDLLIQLSENATKPFYAHPTFLQQLILTDKPDRPNKRLYKTIKSFFHKPNTYYILSALSFARLLRYVMPPIRKVVDLPQFDGYHQYAVDVHSMKSLYYLENIEDLFIQELFESLSKDEKILLKIVTFLHDAGKGRKRDHHIVGATLFKVFANKLHIDDEHIKMGETLIHFHTLMSNVAQREDLYNEKIILAFASHFKTKKLLDMIYILTYADMNGVGKGIYNSFNARLIKTLYTRSIEALTHTTMLDNAAKRIKKEQTLQRHIDFTDLSKSEQKKILSIPSTLLFLRYTPQRIVAIAKKGFETKDYEFHISNDKFLTIEIIRKKSFNIGYFLGRLSNLDVVNMDICKLFDDLKYFKIDFSMQVDKDDVFLIEEILHKSFDDSKKSKLNIPIIKKGDLEIDCNHSQSYAMMRLHTTNQKGLLAYIINMFDDLGIDIVSAKIHSLKNSVRDIFLIEKNGNFCHNTELIIDKLIEEH
ncbi:Possible nucleotidyltransferase [hydrothermal vent metagenome]|uniref:Possible nucleotidyltransferase n=1 Tax=hydrothermal vent metagenome TaxID=652676 RepID=A0A1W1ECB6_9ZZZZ